MNKQIQCSLTAAIVYLGVLSAAFAQPRITTQPTDQSVSLGATVTELVFASGLAPLSYQWRLNDAEIAAATKRTLILTNVTLANAGSYSVVVTDTSGSVTSRVARLEVDPTFTMITAGPGASSGTSVSTAWGDYDNDGFLDLLIGNIDQPNFLSRNKGDGTFERVLANVVGGLTLGSGAWGDYDNDGFLDLYSVSGRDLGVSLYHNQGDGTLLRVTNAGPILTEHSHSGSMAWGDFDNDGFLDVFVANGTFQGDLKNFLFHNQGSGTFTKVTDGSIVNELRTSWTGAWVDYDDDGLLDMFVTNNGFIAGVGEDNQLFHNDGASGFTLLTAAQTGMPMHDGGYSRGCAWGDYDNDWHLDLFVAGRTNLLYHNNGDGTFKKITAGPIVTDSTPVESIGCTWVDYDNDGYLDLFVVNPGDNNFFYHNNGDGTFTRIDSGSLVNDGDTIVSIDGAWADYDNDGFMDAVVVAANGKNSLFHNNGNSNHWINLKLVGTASNRAAFGAKVRLEATIGGRTIWQRRDIGGTTSELGQSDLRAGFGLGGATNINTVRIEWPSGTIQELRNVAINQFLTVTEPARLKGSVIGGQYQLVLNGGVGFSYDVQASPNLVDWSSLIKIQTTNMTMPVMSLDTVQVQQKYFRALRQ